VYKKYKRMFNHSVMDMKINKTYNTPELLINCVDKYIPEEVYREETKETSNDVSSFKTVPATNLSQDPSDLLAAVESVSQQLQQLSRQMMLVQQQLLKIGTEKANTPFETPSVSINSGNKNMAEKKALDYDSGNAKE